MTIPIDPPSESGPSTRLFPKGRLKIFLGASPGVGKTFAMLQAASERKSEGIDVVIGLVETHKRKETEEQLANLEILPRQTLTYRNKSFQELDLDGVLARAPELVLIDECAHTNIPGSRHPKRYNDIDEILEHGIDVYTTVNIQHIESLKDIVEEITHITIRETIPDSFIQSADEVQLIDLPPDDLLQRLADGKVYVPEQAKAAIEHFFTQSNLLTLRELALKQAVTVADEKMAQYVQQLGIKGPWPATDKVMVCVGTGSSGKNLVRMGRRISERLQAKWITVTVETMDDESRGLQIQKQLSRTLLLAEELGSEVVELNGINIAETLVQFAQTNNVTDILLGQPKQIKPWHKIPILGCLFRRQSISEELLTYHPSFTVRVIPTDNTETPPEPVPQQPSLYKLYLPYLYSLLITLGMLFAADQITKHTKITDISTFFFLSILWVSIKFGLQPALLATVVGSLVYDYHYVEPKYHFGITNFQAWVLFASFTFTAIVISKLTIHSKNVLLVSQGRLRQIRFFSKFASQLLNTQKPNQILTNLCKELHRFLNISIIGFLNVHENLKPNIILPKNTKLELSDVDKSAIQWALAHQKQSGKSTDSFSEARYLYLPLKIGNNSLGVIGIRGLKGQLKIDDVRIAQTLIDQAALAIDRLSSIDKKHMKH